MTKTKAMIGLTVLVGLLAISTSSALAEWQTTNGTSHGNITAGPGVLSVTGGTVECASAEGDWQIRKADAKQEPQLKGGHLNIQIKQWNKCKAVNLAATVSSCEFQLKQRNGQTTNVLGDILKGCEVKAAGGCVITVPPSNEKTGENYQLGKTTLENEGLNQLDKVEVSGITYTATSCLGVTSGKAGEEKVPKLLIEGANAS
jgi:hypothetical protein